MALLVDLKGGNLNTAIRRTAMVQGACNIYRIVLITVALSTAVVFGLVAESVHVENRWGLQNAIDTAPSGTELILASGVVFEGPIRLDRDITLRTSGACTSVDPIESLPLFYGANTAISCDHATIHGPLIVDDCSIVLAGIRVESELHSGVTLNNSNLEMEGCSIEAAVIGIHLRGVSTATVTDTTIADSGSVGIVVESGASIKLMRTEILLSRLGGISVFGTAEIYESSILFSGYLAERMFPIINWGDLTTVRDEATAFGVALWTGSQLRLENSTIAWSKGAGIRMADYRCGLEVPPVISGSGNVIPGGHASYANVAGFSDPLVEEMSIEWRLAVQKAEFLKDTYWSLECFDWSYFSNDYEIRKDLEIPLAQYVDRDPGRTSYGLVDEAEHAANHFTTLTSLKPLADAIHEICKAEGFGEVGMIEMMVSFIYQNVRYDLQRKDDDLRSASGYQLPVDTLVMGSGVCRDSSVLASAMLDLVGFDTVLVSLPPLQTPSFFPLQTDLSGHMVVGVATSEGWGTYVIQDDVRFYLIDPTSSTGQENRGDSPRLGEFDLDAWRDPKLIVPKSGPDLSIELVYNDAEESMRADILGELTVTNRGTRSSVDGEIHFCESELFTDLLKGSNLTWSLPALAPGESVSFTIPVSQFDSVTYETHFTARIVAGDIAIQDSFLYLLGGPDLNNP